jgi:hypothetical protein
VAGVRLVGAAGQDESVAVGIGKAGAASCALVDVVGREH